VATERALASAGPSRLAQAVVLAEAGVVEEAAGALDALEQANPGSVVLAGWRESLRGRH
jgi:hypothetical protein